MGSPFLGELKLVSFNFAPKSWSMCNGQLLPINQNQALFSLMGTYYGGNGQTTFALPDLRGRTPISQGTANTIGSRAGTETVTLTQSSVPAHTHFATAIANNANATSASGNYLSATTGVGIYNAVHNLVQMDPGTTSNIGGSQAHSNQQPYLVMTWVISLQGIFPSQN